MLPLKTLVQSQHTKVHCSLYFWPHKYPVSAHLYGQQHLAKAGHQTMTLVLYVNCFFLHQDIEGVLMCMWWQRQSGAGSVRTDSRSPWGRAHEHGHDGRASRLLCPWARAGSTHSTVLHQASTSTAPFAPCSLPGAILTARLTRPPSPHRLPRAAQPWLHMKSCKKLL